MKRSFKVAAVWDPEAEVWFSESEIIGLNIEAGSLEEFVDLVNEFAPDLIVSNHYSERDLSGVALRDIIPAVVIFEGRLNPKVA
ncbi:MAG: DUF1902 domain-containing protein [Pseudomonadota bacterium]